MFLRALLAVCPVAWSAAPFPITPQPLRLLVQESEFIVTAWVRESDPSTRTKDLARTPWEGDEVVVLEIETLVKGDPGVPFIEQVNDHGMICPLPAIYDPGTHVLAFLDRRTDGHGFWTHGLSYGAKALDDGDLAVYLQRIREQQVIEAMPDDALRLAAQVEWLVACAEHPATRWEGAYELADPYYDDPVPDFGAQLSETQRNRLRDALLGSEGFGDGEQRLEELFSDDPDPRLLAWLVAQFRKHHEEVAEHPCGEAAALVEPIARRDGRPEVRKLGDAFGEKQMSYCGGERDGPGFLAIARELLACY